MRPRILFVVMSAVHQAAAVDELARALAPHTVLVHHDFSQTPEFELRAPNVLFVPEPLRTAWGRFSFVEAIFHSLRYAVENLEFDYLQLLSPTCLPIKPIRAFEAHISGSAEAHFGCIDLLANHDALMSLGHRAFAPDSSWRYRLARYLTFSQYYRGTKGQRQEAGIWYKTGFAAGRGGRMTLAARLARLVIIALSNPAIGRHRFDADLRPYAGSVWFGARRHVIGALIAAYARPGIRDFFSKVVIAEEFLIPTLLKTQEIRTGPLNHHISVFDEAHPQWMADADFETLRRSPAFFARKFADDTESAVRKRVLGDLVYGHDEAIERIHPVRAVANG
jgi:Core-2/I-Branching enzyme